MKRRIDPNNYKCVGFMDTTHPRQILLALPGIGYVKFPDDEEFKLVLEGYFAQSQELFGRKYPPKKCAHCGKTGLRWVVAVEDARDGKREAWGEICAEEAALADFPSLEQHRAKREAELGKSRAAIAKKQAAFEEENPGFYGELCAHLATPPFQVGRFTIDFGANNFLADLRAKFERYGDLSVRQVEAARKSMRSDNERATRIEKQDAEPKKPAPEGRVCVRGEVVSIKEYASDWGFNQKMTLKGDGWRVWLTVPSKIEDASLVGDEVARIERGDVIEVTATFERSKDDDSFAFGKRPSKCRVIATASNKEASNG